jgi:hypothetical protein
MKKKLFLCTFVVVIFTTLVGCSKDGDDGLSITSPNNVELTSKGTSQITCSDSKASYSSEDEYVATVSESGLITAKRIGETYIDVNGQQAVKVTVKPIITSFTEPQFLFGATKEEVYSKVGSNYTKSNDSGVAYTTTSGKVKGYIYLMKNGKVTGVCMVVSTLYIESLTDFLVERYVPAAFSEEDYTALYINALSLKKATMIIGEQLYSSSLINVLYMPYDNNASKSRTVEKKQYFIEQANVILKQLNLK